MKIIKINIILFFILTNSLMVLGQKNPYWQEPTAAETDSLKILLQSTENDSVKMYINWQLGWFYQERNRYTAFEYFTAQLLQAKNLKQKIWEAGALNQLGYISSLSQNYPGALNYLLAAREIASDPNSGLNMWGVHLLTDDGIANSARLTILLDNINHFGVLNYFVGNFEKAIDYYQEAAELNSVIQDEVMFVLLHMNKGESYFPMGKNDLAKTELKTALDYSQSSGYDKYRGLIYWDIGKIYEKENNYREAKKYYELSVATNIESDSPDFLGEAYLALANLYIKKSSLDSGYQSAHNGLSTYMLINDSVGLMNSYSTLAAVFDARGQIDSAYYYMKKETALKSAMNREERVKEFQILGLNEQLRLKEMETEKVLLQSRIRMYGLAAGIGVLFLISMITYRNNIRQKKNKAIIEKSYENLKSTQAQLVQQEKLASLGQLTAGIAHEIKNPLNFVNNFSEVSGELVDEMNEELEKGDIEEAKAIGKDLKENLSKINHHGKRADTIVKGMLAHSRTSTGEKIPTDINALADEYLRLSYHGLRAKDNSFNADYKTDFDPNLPKVNVVPQDIGRVLLNLINNAFQACAERKGQLSQSSKLWESFQPLVTISTKNLGDKIEIKVFDNGPGIPDDIKDKILQPFFTTKKGTEGTGLGLSITHDIVKAHGGELSVNSTSGSGSTFIITLKP